MTGSSLVFIGCSTADMDAGGFQLAQGVGTNELVIVVPEADEGISASPEGLWAFSSGAVTLNIAIDPH